MPLVMMLSYWVQLLGGSPIPRPHIAPLTVPALFLVYLLAAVCEELGWMGYAMPLMRRRGWRTSASSLAIGLIWAVWHYVPLLEAGRTPAWIAWWSLGTVAARVIIVWLYDNTGGSVLAAAVFHDMVNVTYSLFPGQRLLLQSGCNRSDRSGYSPWRSSSRKKYDVDIPCGRTTGTSH
jgi:uncharacterized protein